MMLQQSIAQHFRFFFFLLLDSESPAAIPSLDWPSIVEIVLLLVLSCVATEPKN